MEQGTPNHNKKKSPKNKSTSRHEMSRRFKIVTAIFFVALSLVVIRLVWICVVDGEKYTMAAITQYTSQTYTVEAKRGDIQDRNGIQLVTSARVYNLILDPKVILTDSDSYLQPTVSLIEKCFGISSTELVEKINNNQDSHYIVLKKDLTYSDVEEFSELAEEDNNVNGVWLEDGFKRMYLYDTLASSLLGFTRDNEGQYGIEASYNDELKGTDGMQYTYVGDNNVAETVVKEAQAGHNIVSTIDYNIQSICEKYIKEWETATNAKQIAVIIQNPNTGEIYAMADSGTFNPNSPSDLSLKFTAAEIQTMSDEDVTKNLTELWQNYCITNTYEPGSTYKPFTLAACLTEDVVKMEDTFSCSGSLTFYDTVEISCHEQNGHGTLDTKGAIAQSCNVALMTMAQNLGTEKFCQAQTRFGFGHLTDIDLPGETSCNGLLYTAENMGLVDLVTNSFGQNFNVTMVQMVSAFSSLVNGGYYYKPYVVKGIYNENGEQISATERTLVNTTVSKDITDKVKECLRSVVKEGTGQEAAVTGYKIAGKTGTAEINSGTEVTEEGEYAKKEDAYVISFIGFAPYDNPEVVCYVVLDEPNTGEDSSQATKLFSHIMSEVLPYLNITPDGDATDVAYFEGGYTEPSTDETAETGGEDNNTGDGEQYTENEYTEEENNGDEYTEETQEEF